MSRVWVPSLAMLTSTLSPDLRKAAGSFMPTATPSGVPVVTTSPGSRVMYWLRYHRQWGTEKIMSLVLLFCRNAPLTLVLTSKLAKSGRSSGVIRKGPSGPKLSALLPFTHCPPCS
ncbi:MAG: hypothetical protein O7C61_01110, partial [SAR324 cluster bacterium]|nr:hypothetical protein [SAR324 cluster bacterium]